MSADDCLKLPIFDDIRCPELEKNADFVVEIPVDNNGCFDYARG